MTADTAEPGWYSDPGGGTEGAQRYWDGARWTDQVHVPEPSVPVQPVEPALRPSGDPVGSSKPPKQLSKPASIALYLTLGVFWGALVGMTAFNAVNAYGPSSTEEATITAIEVEFSSGSRSGANRTTRWVEGTSESGRDWRFASDEAYETVDRSGYPTAVTVTFSEWTDTVVALQSDALGLDLDQRGLASRVVWPLGTVVVLALGAVMARHIHRKEGGPVVAAAFVFGLLVIGTYLGFIAIRWYRM